MILSQIFTILGKPERRHYKILAVLSVLSSFFQTLSVAGVSLFFTILLGGALPPRIQELTGGLSFPATGGLVLLLVLLGTSSSALTTYYGIRLSWRQYEMLASRLLDEYLHRDYEWHITQNTAELSNAVITQAQRIVNEVLQQVVMILVRGSEMILIGGLLVATRPLIAVVATGSFLVIYGGLYQLNKRFIHGQGVLLEEAYNDRQLAVNEALSGIKVVKVYGLQGYFLANFRDAANRLSAALANISYISLLPKYFIELLLFGGLIAFVVTSHGRGWNTNESIPLLALYGAAAIRLLPAAQQLYASITVLKGASSSLLGVTETLRTHNPARGRGGSLPAGEGVAISFEGVGYTYGGSAKPALAQMSFSILRGEKIGIVGATGAGKTTLVDLLLGLLLPTEGKIWRAPSASGAASVGYVPQQLHFVDDTIAGNIALGQRAESRDHERIQSAARRACIHDHIQDLPLGYDTPIGEQAVRLSGGQRQRLGIARALYRTPEILVLDEASNALDAETERNVIASLLTQELTLVIISHRISILRDCSRIMVVEAGRIQAEGSFERLLKDSALFRALAAADED